MKRYRYLIVGGGMAAEKAVEGIRAVDAASSIGVLTEESHAPYKRPPLSKGLWKGESSDTVWLSTAREKAEVHTSSRATSVDPVKKVVHDDHGNEFSYEKLLLATGGRVRKLPLDLEGMIYFRTFGDYTNLRSAVEKGDRFLVIGGGFIGTELAAALAMNGKRVSMVFPERRIGERVYPAGLSRFITEYYERKGVAIRAGERVTDVKRHGAEFSALTSGGSAIDVDAIVVGIGIQPNIELAQEAGLHVADGIVVDEFLQTSHPGIYAAGDVANFFSPVLGVRMRVEHEDNANTMGERAGRNMAGEQAAYHHLPFFYSDLFDLGYEAVGELDSSLETIENWKEKNHEGVVYYLRNGIVRGVLLWNTWGQVDNARRLLSTQTRLTAETAKGLLPV